jgi:hypothetical protein
MFLDISRACTLDLLLYSIDLSFRRIDKSSKRWATFKGRAVCAVRPTKKSSTTFVTMTPTRRPWRRASTLGQLGTVVRGGRSEALSHNTVVSELLLNVNDVVDCMEELKHYEESADATDEDNFNFQGFVRRVHSTFNPLYLDAYCGGAALLLRYIQSSAALRLVGLKEGKSPSNRVTRYILLLALTAVSRNPHLAEFHVDMKLPAEPLAYLLSTAQSLTLLCMSMYHFTGQHANQDSVIAEGLASNKRYRTVSHERHESSASDCFASGNAS